MADIDQRIALRLGDPGEQPLRRLRSAETQGPAEFFGEMQLGSKGHHHYIFGPTVVLRE
jgi:hypothetical protein